MPLPPQQITPFAPQPNMPASPQQTKLSFGIELEYVEKSPDHDAIALRHGFVSRHDASVQRADGSTGYEMVSPVMFADITAPSSPSIPCPGVSFNEQPVTDMCLLATLVNKTCGLHVHVGNPTARDASKSKWTDAQVHAWLVTGQVMEEALYSVCPPSRRQNTHAKPIESVYVGASYFSGNPANPTNPSKYHNHKRYCWLNIVETARIGTAEVAFDAASGRGTARALGTVEIRMLGNTRHAAFVNAWTRFCLQWGAVIATREPAMAISAIIHGGFLEPALQALKYERRRIADSNTVAVAAQRGAAAPTSRSRTAGYGSYDHGGRAVGAADGDGESPF